MNTKTTWWLVAVAIGLFGYIVFVERRAAEGPSRNLPPARLFPELDPLQVTGLEIVHDTNLIRVERVQEQWQLTTPLYPAESVRIQNLLRALSLATQRAFVPAEEVSGQANALASFGLSPPQASVTLFQGTNRLRFQVGAKTLLDDQVYLQRQGERGIAVTDAQPFDSLPRSAAEWRSPMLLHLERLPFDRVAVTNGPNYFILDFDATSQLWNLTFPLVARADFGAVNYVIQQLRNARISQFVTDDPKVDADKFGLQAPGVEMALAQGTNPVFQLQFGASPTNDATQVYARRLSHSNIVLVPRGLVDLLRTPHENFRDRTLLPFATSVVDRIEVKAKESFALDKGTNGAWRIVSPFVAPADASAVQQFFESLAKLEISKFTKDVVTDFAAFGLAQPARQYVLRTTLTNALGITNRIVAQVGFSTNNVDEVYARRGEEVSVYTVSYGDTLQLPQAAFELRDRRIWRFPSSDVTSILVTQANRTNKLARSANRTWTPDPVLNEAIEETVYRLSRLEATSWRAKGQQNLRLFGFVDNPHQITLETTAEGKTQTYTLKLGKRRNQDEAYAAVELEEKEPVIFLIPITLHAMAATHLSGPAEAPKP